MKTFDYQPEFRKAIRHYWRSKNRSLEKNRKGSRVDQGQRGAATSGKNMDGFVIFFSKLAQIAGGKDIQIYHNKSNVILPGHFRPTKQWDLVVIKDGKLLAALEFKALGGPSFGNNANNRCEEAIGSGIDLQVAQREGRLGDGANPFVGFLILVEDVEKSSNPPTRGNPSPHFASDPIFSTASYQQRMKILCDRMTQERIYSYAAAFASKKTKGNTGDFKELSENQAVAKLIKHFIAHLEAES